MMQFQIQQEPGSIIKVIGVGGGGSNAVNHMFRQGITGVDFIICNTDIQALGISPVPHKIQLGINLTKGLGAGSLPEMGKNSALETIDEIRKYLSDGTQMVFITAGLGGGTGTGAAPIIASVAREMGILSVGIVTLPFSFEGKKRRVQAEQGLEEMKKYVDTLLVIGNDKLREIYGNLKMSEAFAHADNVLTNAARAIAEIISINLHVNVDFNDVKTVMKDSGVAIMGSATASGDKRALKAVENALNSPLLNDNNIRGARHVLLNIMSGSDDITMDEFGEITDFIQEESGYTAELITGYGIDQSLGDNVSVTIIATGFKTNAPLGFEPPRKAEKTITLLEDHSNTHNNLEAITYKVSEAQPAEEKNELNTSSDEPFIVVKKQDTQKPANPIENFVQEELFSSLNETETNIEAAEENTDAEEMTMEIAEVTVDITAETDTFVNNEVEVPSIEIVERHISTSTPVENTYGKDPASMSAEELLKFEREERIRAAQERIKKLKDISLKLKTPEGLLELEKEPSFQRNGIKLSDNTPSAESSVSRYTLSEGDDKKMEIRPNNSFLHDNVD